jgi:hypothetical protein
MDIDLAVLPNDVETLQRMVRTLAAERTATLAEAQAEIERLRLIVQKLQRSQFGRRAEPLDDDQLQFGFEDLEADLARAEAGLPSRVEKSSNSNAHVDRPSLPAHLPREDTRLDIEHQTCPCCGGKLHLVGETVSEMLDHVPARLRVIRIRRPRYGCRACGTMSQQPGCGQALGDRPLRGRRLMDGCSTRAAAAPRPAGFGSTPATTGPGVDPIRRRSFISTARIGGPSVLQLTWRISEALFKSTVIPDLSSSPPPDISSWRRVGPMRGASSTRCTRRRALISRPKR